MMFLRLTWVLVFLGTSQMTTGQMLMSPLLKSQLTALSDDHVTKAAGVLQLLPPLHHVLNSSKDTGILGEQCNQHLQIYMQGLAIKETWALKMLDASTKVPESILNGAWLHIGNFDECLSVKAPGFPVQHCGPSIVFLQGDFSLSLQVASCLPATCDSVQIEEAISSVLVPLFSSIGVDVSVSNSDRDCYSNDKKSIEAGGYVMISVFCLIGLMTISGTCYDLLFKNMKKTEIQNKFENAANDILMSFSLKRNWMSLISTRHAPGSITCLHGLRVLSLWWIIIGHRFGQNLAVPLINPLEFINHLAEPAYSLILNAYMAVDTFFFISGFLVCHVFFADRTRGRKFNVFSFYLYRYIRLTTCLALLVGFYVTLIRHIGYGPRWNATLDWQMDHCDKYWYLNLLYLTNYVRFDHDTWTPATVFADCVDQGWYLTVDMQLAWLSPLVLVPLYKWPRQSMLYVLVLVFASCFAPFISTYINEFPMVSSMNVSIEEVRKYIIEMYWATHMRATPYLIGILLAYFMNKMKQVRVIIPKLPVVAFWAASTATCLAIVFATAIQYSPDYEYDVIAASFYGGFHRLGWSLSLSWIVFACSRGYGGPVNSILSWRIFLPFSRLSYCMFLTHFVQLFYDSGQVRTYANYSNFNNTMDVFSDLWVTSLFLGLPLYLCCEAPTLNLLRVYFRNDKQKTKKSAIIETIIDEIQPNDEVSK